MFCCTICRNLFCGIHPEIIVTTKCGHVFHYKCILLCLKKTSKCPFCSLPVKETQLIKLHLQIDTNWKNTAASLNTNKPNTSIINLDESINDTLNLCNNSSAIVVEPVSLVTIPKNSSSFFYKLEQNLKVYESKTLLTTSLPTKSLPK